MTRNRKLYGNFSKTFLMAAQTDNYRYSTRNLDGTVGFDKTLNGSFNHRHIVSPTLTFKDRIPSDVRRTGQPSVGSF